MEYDIIYVILGIIGLILIIIGGRLLKKNKNDKSSKNYKAGTALVIIGTFFILPASVKYGAPLLYVFN